MKLYLDEDFNYLELNKNAKGGVDLSFRISVDKGSTLLLGTDLDLDQIDRIITELISLRAEVQNDQRS